jgi:hypothetical protein
MWLLLLLQTGADMDGGFSVGILGDKSSFLSRSINPVTSVTRYFSLPTHHPFTKDTLRNCTASSSSLRLFALNL